MGLLDWIKGKLGYNRCPQCGSANIKFVIKDTLYNRAYLGYLHYMYFSNSPTLINKHFCPECAYVGDEAKCSVRTVAN